jgi:hypothetical protein
MRRHGDCVPRRYAAAKACMSALSNAQDGQLAGTLQKWAIFRHRILVVV